MELFFFARFFATMPLKYLYFKLPGTRGTPDRNLDQSIKMSNMFDATGWLLDTRTHLARSLKPGKDWQTQFVVFDPPSDKQKYFTSFIDDANIKPEPVPGIWYPSIPTSADFQQASKRFIIHFHGGGYAAGAYEPSDTKVTGMLMAEHLSAFFLSAGYRKSAQPGSHFPAQLQDAITTYQYVLGQGVPPAKIILDSDSAGGHLVVDLLRYLLENPSAGLHKPAAITLCSI